MSYLISLGLFFPLIGFFILMASSYGISRRAAGYVGCAAIGFSFLCFCSLLLIYTNGGIDHESVTLFKWIPVEGINADFKLHVDHLSLLMTLIITGIGFLIHVYSIGYMDHETDFARYFACMNFFVFSMLLLVLASHLLVLFVGWEGVGLASYLLIGFWYDRPAAGKAATKAFVINRIGDLGLLLGLLLTFYIFGTGDIEEISNRVGQEFAVGAPILTLMTLLYFVGAIGKSAQLPLYTWLPDAMEGPTPVSALIHAATMVTAGIYLVVRMHSVFLFAPTTLNIIGGVGGATACFAALCAVAQTDLKRVLAYSTISQLGLMFLACGIGAFYSAMFHLTMHAFMKSLLFLSAGNVVHMMHGTTEMSKMGGLAKIFTKTHWLFLIGVLAMSGIPPLAAFFSKDLILDLEYLSGHEFLFYIGLATSILTAFYLTRAYCLTFLGESNLEEKIAKTVKEAPVVMLVPVAILAFLSLIGGFFGSALFDGTPILVSFLDQIGITIHEKELTSHLSFSYETIVSIVGGFLGLITAGLMYTKFIDRLGSPIQLLKNSFYVNEIYAKIFVGPLKALSSFIGYTVEPRLFDGSIKATVNATQGIAQQMQKLQSGQIRSYVAWMVLGSVLLVVFFVF